MRYFNDRHVCSQCGCTPKHNGGFCPYSIAEWRKVHLAYRSIPGPQEYGVYCSNECVNQTTMQLVSTGAFGLLDPHDGSIPRDHTDDGAPIFRLNRYVLTAVFWELVSGDFYREPPLGYNSVRNSVFTSAPYVEFCHCEDYRNGFICGPVQERCHRCMAPNFVHHESGLQIWWYKYPFRSPEGTLGTVQSVADLQLVVDECIKSLS